jgi:MFS family permease
MTPPSLGSPTETKNARLFTPAFILLSLAELAYFTAAGLEIPLAPLFAAEVLGANEVGVGVAVGALSLTALILRPVAGRTSDRLGRRPLLIWGAGLYAVATALHALAPDLTVMIGLRLLLGVAEAFFFVAGFAALADLAPPGRTGEALSFNSLSLYLGTSRRPGWARPLWRSSPPSSRLASPRRRSERRRRHQASRSSIEPPSAPVCCY